MINIISVRLFNIIKYLQIDITNVDDSNYINRQKSCREAT